MEKLNCSIIKDLIPSYLDGICSEDSREAVEEHLASCEPCRAHAKSLERLQLIPGRSHEGELDFMKLVKRYYARKNALGAALLFVLSVMILPVIATLHPNRENIFYHILFTVLAIGTYLLLSNYQKKSQNLWPGIVSLAASIFGVLYAVSLAAILYHCIQTDSGIWGLALNEMGPVLNRQFILAAILELSAFAVCAAESVRKECSPGFLPSLNLTCCSLSMCFRELLFHMDTPPTLLRAIFQEAEAFLLLTAGILLAEFALSHIRSCIDKKTGFPL